MLNVFPELLNFGFMAPTALRLTVGIFLLFLGYQKFTSQKESLIDFLNSIKIQPATTTVQVLGFVEIILGVLFVLGAFTQIAALITLIISAVSLVVRAKTPELKLRSSMEYVFITVISLSILLTGAGFFAIDLPL